MNRCSILLVVLIAVAAHTSLAEAGWRRGFRANSSTARTFYTPRRSSIPTDHAIPYRGNYRGFGFGGYGYGVGFGPDFRPGR
ncbi:hypothetical protein ACYFX5_13755 [Bremerella sp. T1]|uniref:hypothetical protein n=1 Tax=Bremerella sp. TYQ1 TaxID=3119568 RepID=UPI001CCD7F3D|nr:hypothetical protein [Bremerella volcania]UBM34124.1 hypothetical protein LA756_15695 [Bremerella volcania]